MVKSEDLYVDDKRLGDLLKAIAGIARGMPRPVPVANIDEVSMKAKLNGGNLVAVFAAHITKEKITEVGPKDVQDWLAKHGKSRQSANYVCQGLKKAGMVKRTGKSQNSRYTVVKHG